MKDGISPIEHILAPELWVPFFYRKSPVVSREKLVLALFRNQIYRIVQSLVYLHLP